MKESKKVLEILIAAEESIKKDKTYNLKHLSEEAIESASITQDPENLTVAVVVYSLGKIFERKQYKNLKGWENFKKITLDSLKKAIEDIRNKNSKDFQSDLLLIRRAIGKISGKLKIYIEDVFKKAEINNASKIYERGLSLEKTSKLLGVSLYDLQNYAGQQNFDNYISKNVSVKERIKYLEDLFK